MEEGVGGLQRVGCRETKVVGAPFLVPLPSWDWADSSTSVKALSVTSEHSVAVEKFDPGPAGLVDFQSVMARALVWLENSTFAAWGCKACNWILRGLGPTAAGKPSEEIQQAFDEHDCSRFPRVIDSKAKRPRDSSSD
jgi:hypothetical protein